MKNYTEKSNIYTLITTPKILDSDYLQPSPSSQDVTPPTGSQPSSDYSATKQYPDGYAIPGPMEEINIYTNSQTGSLLYSPEFLLTGGIENTTFTTCLLTATEKMKIFNTLISDPFSVSYTLNGTLILLCLTTNASESSPSSSAVFSYPNKTYSSYSQPSTLLVSSPLTSQQETTNTKKCLKMENTIQIS